MQRENECLLLAQYLYQEVLMVKDDPTPDATFQRRVITPGFIHKVDIGAFTGEWYLELAHINSITSGEYSRIIKLTPYGGHDYLIKRGYGVSSYQVDMDKYVEAQRVRRSRTVIRDTETGEIAPHESSPVKIQKNYKKMFLYEAFVQPGQKEPF